MAEPRPASHWEQRYAEGDLPWDARRPEARLTELARTLTPPTSIALDLGCGHGDNALWLARQGYDALGIDVAPTAIAGAAKRAHAADIHTARFCCASVLEPLPVQRGAVGLALDRGCFHVLADADRARYVAHVGAAMAAGGWWLILCGNADEPRAEGEVGPPQLNADQLVQPLRPWFELHRLERCRFSGADGRPTHLAWRALCRRRADEA